jgi:hypothetical protein
MAVRQVVEECESKEMESGLHIGFCNLRGTFNKAIYEGGDQERKLAELYDRYANICSRWPRIAAVHREMSRGYRADADREDEEARARD